MNRENVLVGLCGILAGFIIGYFVAGGGRAAAPVPAAAPESAAAPAPASAASPAPTAEQLNRVKQLQSAAQADPNNADLQLQLANAYYDMSDWKTAQFWYEKCRPQKNSDPNILTDLGSCYRNTSQFDKAIGMYEKAQKIDPRHFQSLLNLTLVYAFDLKDPAHAQESLDRLRKEHPELPHLDDIQTQISALRAAKS